MSYLIICAVALLASCLTFFSGFGLGTLLLPAFALFFPLEQAIALTALVHLLNNLFKLALVGRHTDFHAFARFGLPAMCASFFGASILGWLSEMTAIFNYTAFGQGVHVMPVKLVVGLLLLVFSLIELIPRFKDLSFPSRYMPLGGVLSGFFGGLAGMQGALRSAFLVRAGLSKESFIATGVAVACLIDLSRLGAYSNALSEAREDVDYLLLSAAVLSAFSGAIVGNHYLMKMTMPAIQRIVAAMLLLVSIGLIAGLL